MVARPFDILVVGELNVDLIVRGDVEPQFGQAEKLVDDFSICAGSSSGILCAQAARMGLRVCFASIVGDDLFGHFMLDSLRQAGLDTRFVVVDPRIKTGVGVMLSRGQDRAMLTYLGSIAAVTAELVRAEWFDQSRHLHVASPFLLTGLRAYMPEMMRTARRAGMTVSLDTNWDPSGRWQVDDLLAHADILLPNENEAIAITRESCLEGAIAVLSQRVPVLAVKRGEAGALVVSGHERVAVPAFPVTVADATGAGDCFDAGFLAGWLRGASLRRCALLGSACGALTVTQVGGFNGQPTWEKANALADTLD